MYKYSPQMQERLERAASCLTGSYRLNYFWGTLMSKALRYTGSSSFDAHEVLPNIFVGDVYAAHNQEELKRRNVTHIINAALAVIPPFPDKFKYLHVQLLDYPGENVMDHLQVTTKYIEEALAGGGRVFIHCLKGVSRSATIAAAFAIYSQQLTTQEAINMLRKQRSIVCPNHGFVLQLEWYEKQMRKSSSFGGNLPLPPTTPPQQLTAQA